MNHYVITKEIYTVLDFIADVGALQYGLFLVLAFLLTLLQFQAMDNFMVSLMF